MWAKRFIKGCMASFLYKIVNHWQPLPNVAVMLSFKKKYPTARYVTWKALQGSIWVASFMRDHREQKAFFKKDGKWLKTSTPIPLGNVPKIISQGLYRDATYLAYKMTFLLDTPHGRYYEFRTDAPHYQEIMRFDVHGKLVKKSFA
jgi:hypothetical protein